MNSQVAHSFRDDFRKAREAAQQDAEDFEQVAFALERLGAYLCATRHNGLSRYKTAIKALACNSPFAAPAPEARPFHTHFDDIFRLVTDCRNSAMHEGVFARNLTQHAIQIAIVIEDALTQIITMTDPDSPQISDFMIRNPICAQMWQPLSFIRQGMLANSFSYLPLWQEDKKAWHVISDLALATYLGTNAHGKSRRARLSQVLGSALVPDGRLDLPRAITVRFNESVDVAISALRDNHHSPMVLVIDEDERHLLGIVTPFDLL